MEARPVTAQSSPLPGAGGTASAELVHAPESPRGAATGTRSIVSSGSRGGGPITISELVLLIASISISSMTSESSSGSSLLSAVSRGGGAGASSNTVASKSSSASTSTFGRSSSSAPLPISKRSDRTVYAPRIARRAALAVKSRRTRSYAFCASRSRRSGSPSRRSTLRARSTGSPGSNSSASRLFSTTCATVSRRGATIGRRHAMYSRIFVG